MNIKKIAITGLQFIINRLIEIIGVSVSIIGVLLFIALVSYSPSDPNFIFPENTKIQNILGFRGSYISDLFFQGFDKVPHTTAQKAKFKRWVYGKTARKFNIIF